ncbi:MAG: dockerin type I domain-containing protein [Candidatus Eisenbacteria bacterium]
MRGRARNALYTGSVFVLAAAGAGWIALRSGSERSVPDARTWTEVRHELAVAEHEEEGKFEAAASIGERRDDPGGRRWQEWLQLRDPATDEIPLGIRERELAFANAAARQAVPNARSYSFSTWSNRGLWNVGGRTRALAIDVSDTSVRTFLAGAISGGIWRTTNEGQSWTLVTGDVGLYAPTCLVQDLRSGRTGTWYCGTGEFLGNSAATVGAGYYGTGIWKSTTGGQSWTLLTATSPGNPVQFDSGFDYVWNVGVDVSNPSQDEVYAATIGGVQRSTDGGQTWNFVKGALGQSLSYQTDVIVNPQGVVFAGLDSDGPDKGIWRSSDGVGFTNITPPAMPTSYGRMVFGLAPSNNDVLWVLVAPGSQGGNHKLFKYSLSGNSWTDRSAQLTGLPVVSEPNWTFDSQGGYDLVMKVKPDDENAVFIGGVHLIRSTDQFQSANGRAWVGGWLYPDPNQPPYEQHSDQHVLVFHPTNPTIAYTGSDGGVWKTTNILASTVRWTSLNNGYLSTQFYHVAIDEGTSGSAAIACGLQDNGCWSVHNTNPAATWLDQFGGDGCYVHIADGATAGGNYYVSAQYSVVYRVALNPDGSDAQDFQRVDPASLTEQNVLFVNPTALDPSDTRRMYMASLNGLWRANNVTAISTANPNQETDTGWVHLTNIANEYVTAIAASKVPADIAYYAGFNLNSRKGLLYKITNASQAPANTTPTNITGSNFPDGYINCIAVDPTDANKVLIAISNYEVPSLFYTTNGGTTWTDVEGNLGGAAGPSARACLIMPVNGTTVFFAGTSTGLYSTSSLNGAATTWTPEGTDTIRNMVVAWLVGRPSDGTVVAATHGGGVFTASVSGSSESCATRAADVNGDNQVDVTDLTRIVNHILGIQILSAAAQLCADVSGEGSINAVDLVQTVGIILGQRPADEGNVDLSPLAWSRRWDGNRLQLDLDASDLAAFQVDLQLAKGTRLAGAPMVDGIANSDLSWHQRGQHLVILVPPDLGLSVRPTPITVSLDLASVDASETAAPISVEVLGVSPEGKALPSVERSFTDGAGSLAVLSLGPNPSRGPVEVRFRAPDGVAVRASIHDVTGREIRSFAPTAGTGDRTLAWDGRDDSGRDVTSGTYFVRVQTGSQTTSRTFQVLR